MGMTPLLLCERIKEVDKHIEWYQKYGGEKWEFLVGLAQKRRNKLLKHKLWEERENLISDYCKLLRESFSPSDDPKLRKLLVSLINSDWFKYHSQLLKETLFRETDIPKKEQAAKLAEWTYHIAFELYLRSNLENKEACLNIAKGYIQLAKIFGNKFFKNFREVLNEKIKEQLTVFKEQEKSIESYWEIPDEPNNILFYLKDGIKKYRKSKTEIMQQMKVLGIRGVKEHEDLLQEAETSLNILGLRVFLYQNGIEFRHQKNEQRQEKWLPILKKSSENPNKPDQSNASSVSNAAFAKFLQKQSCQPTLYDSIDWQKMHEVLAQIPSKSAWRIANWIFKIECLIINKLGINKAKGHRFYATWSLFGSNQYRHAMATVGYKLMKKATNQEVDRSNYKPKAR